MWVINHKNIHWNAVVLQRPRLNQEGSTKLAIFLTKWRFPKIGLPQIIQVRPFSYWTRWWHGDLPWLKKPQRPAAPGVPTCFRFILRYGSKHVIAVKDIKRLMTFGKFKYMCIFMYFYVCVCLYIYIYVCKSMYLYVYLKSCIFMYIYVYLYDTYIYIYIFMNHINIVFL